MLSCTCSNSWKRFLQFSSILLLLGLGMVLAVPTSSDSGEGGRWEWDEVQERRVFFPESRGLHRPSPGMDFDISPNGVPLPYLEADPQYEWIYGWDWPVGNTVYVCVDSSDFAVDPTNPTQCDLFASSMVASGTYGMVDFDVGSFFDLQSGEFIAMTDTVTTKQHQVTSLTVTEVDAVADTVTGTADPGSTVYVHEYDGANWITPPPIADGSGDWSGSYSGIYDLLPGSSGFASQYDPDSDLTWWYWEVPNPTITANPGFDQISGDEWPEGETVHVCVTSSGFATDPTIPAQCDYYDNAVVDPPSGPTTTYVSFDLSGVYDLQGGDYIAMTDTNTTKQHQVTNLDVTDVDPLADTITGTAAPGSDLYVYEYDSYNTINLTADGSGNWLADYSGLTDMVAGTSGRAAQADNDGDETYVRWEVPNPWLSAAVDSDIVYALDWPVGDPVHLCVDDTGFAADPTNPLQCDLYYGSGLVPMPPSGNISQLNFYLSGDHDLQAGDYIAMTDGTTTKQHQVMNLTITNVDVGTDTVYGTADPLSDIDVRVFDCSGVCVVQSTADGSGNWSADFSTIGIDILPGDSGYASQFDLDDDETWLQWSVPLYELYLPLIMR